MIRFVFLFALVFFSATIQSIAQQVKIEIIRDHFFLINKTEDGAVKLFKLLEKENLSKDAVLLAYRGASMAASAGSATGVRKKLEYFTHGKSELEKAVGMKPLDAEIRFLRFATQMNAPGFLGYNGDIKKDKALMIQTFASIPANHPNAYLYGRICQFILAYGELNSSDKTIVKQLVAKFNTKN